MEYFVYILKSENGKHYIGYTCNLIRRYREHCNGNTSTTSKMGKIKLLGYFEFFNKSEALIFEKKIKKSGHTERFLTQANFIKHSIDK